MTAGDTPVNSTTAAGKDTVLAILRRDQARFARLISESEIWELEMNFTNRLRKPLRPKRWQVCEIVPHMTEAVDAYLTSLRLYTHGERARTEPKAIEATYDQGSQQAIVARFSTSSAKLHSLLSGLSDEEWTSALVPHPSPLNRDGAKVFDRPYPAGQYGTFALIDVAVHTYDIQYGLGGKLTRMDEATAGLVLPMVFQFWGGTVDERAAARLEAQYGIEVGGPWGGRWRATVSSGRWTIGAETGDFNDCDALFRYQSASDLVLTFLGRFPGGSASGDPDIIANVRDLFYPF